MNANLQNNVRSVRRRGGRVTGNPVDAEIDARLRALCEREAGRELSCEEIATKTGLSHSGVHYLQSRAILKIRRALMRDGVKIHEGMLVA